ncbi:hypothetical protein DSO57_1014190 [Entomophthora muscae]|uniref:Uncharacterized protein n=1 Tax=Entomophthora muscae TaxID=34485 RepID=A0ACC2T5K0_9FUNG|nr:hypothetical protein DSO57_1014190 [Entomophthora muscae]
MPPKYPPTIGIPKRVKYSSYDFITANLPAINVTKLNYNKSIAQVALQETKGLFPDSSDFLDKFIPAIKVSKVDQQKTAIKPVETGTSRSTSVPLKQFINALLPAVGVSEGRDCFSAQLELSTRNKAPSFFNQCHELLQELEHEKLLSSSIPKQDQSLGLKEKYTESLASNLPHSILLRFDVLSCVSKLLSTIIVLPPDKCELYLTDSFPVDDYPFSGLSGPEVCFKIYASLNGASNQRDKTYVLTLFAKILSIDSNSLIGPYFPDTLKSDEFLASTFKTPKLADLYIGTFIQNGQLEKALRVFASAYLSKPSLLNFELNEKQILHALRQYQEELRVAKKQPVGFPKLQTCLDLANICIA